ncbi:hypothetical protein EDEG_00066 [Edhazardia aedis USNM 41457]|uniref:Uncharacterized protein n=1 Tax=Edhazardia aedis (strain USNM 41457) TaxID=1003232 RepID=J9DBT1_EDHAE|nr:hypothetical protein EDEG_00066 [Edhazardia aedis USNM 41457]|eukprot:EJW04949.1 hypothetical protein EDEG_00066 [Edhazardia aedis USNM 41457]
MAENNSEKKPTKTSSTKSVETTHTTVADKNDKKSQNDKDKNKAQKDSSKDKKDEKNKDEKKDSELGNFEIIQGKLPADKMDVLKGILKKMKPESSVTDKNDKIAAGFTSKGFKGVNVCGGKAWSGVFVHLNDECIIVQDSQDRIAIYFSYVPK